MGKNNNRNNRGNSNHPANGRTANGVTSKPAPADNLASAVEWVCKADFGPSLAYLMAGYYLTAYVRERLTAEKERAGGGGNLSATRAAAKKVAEGKCIEATGNDTLPDMDLLIKTYSAYALLSGHVQPEASTCEAPWSGFRALGGLVERKDHEAEGWEFVQGVDAGKAHQVYTDWLISRPRVLVKNLDASVRQLLGKEAKAAPAPKVKEAAPAPTPVSGETPATIAPPDTVPESSAQPPVPSEGTTVPADNPAAPSVAAEEARPDATEGAPVNPNFVPGGPPADDFDDEEDDEEDDAGTPAPDPITSDLAKPGKERRAEEKGDDAKPKSAAYIARDALLAADDAHVACYDFGQAILAEKDAVKLLTAIVQGVIDAATDYDGNPALGAAPDAVMALFSLLDLALKATPVAA